MSDSDVDEDIERGSVLGEGSIDRGPSLSGSDVDEDAEEDEMHDDLLQAAWPRGTPMAFDDSVSRSWYVYLILQPVNSKHRQMVNKSIMNDFACDTCLRNNRACFGRGKSGRCSACARLRKRCSFPTLVKAWRDLSSSDVYADNRKAWEMAKEQHHNAYRMSTS